ncbi:MAG TPA: CocE/NonD family hydrolase [Actinomycetota bacterium]
MFRGSSRSRRRIGLAAASALFALAATVSTVNAQEVPDPLDDLVSTVEGILDPPGAAAAAEPGTQPIYSYADAIRERVFIQGDFNSDAAAGNTENDTIAIDIIRPLETDTEGLEVPVIMDASPYYSTLGRGNESELKNDMDGDGVLEKFPLFYDNYFVPRGYAVVLLDMAGTSNSNGCPVTGGTPDNLSPVTGIDWLNGRRPGRYADGSPAVADWHSGKTGIIGKSYDGMLSVAAAASGVEGLTTFVPIAPTTSYYLYTRMNGIVHRGSSYPSSLSSTVTNPDRRSYCAPVRNEMAANDGDEHGDMNAFWDERDYLPLADNVNASMFFIHGLQDDNVRTDHFSKWWYAMAERDVPRKLWLTGTGHIDPFDFRRAKWVETIHRWFDHWLYEIENGIMEEPMVDVEVAADVWETHEDWPIPGTEMLDLHLRPGASETTNGILALSRGTEEASTSFSDASITETNAMNNPTTVTTNRRVFLSAPLEAPVRLSGTPLVKLVASANQADTNLGAIVVDYGTKAQISRTGDGITTLMTESCHGESTSTDDACYRDTAKATTTSTQWRVHRGVLDALNRDSIREPSPLVPGQVYNFNWELLPNDYTFPAGHQIGVIVVGNYSGFTPESTNATITLDLLRSKVTLPVVGGYAGAAASQGFPDDNPPTVTVPDDIVVEADSGEGTVVEYETSVSDLEDPAPTLECDPPSGSRFPVGETTVTCTGRDGYGNETTETFMVTVVPWAFEGFFDPVKNPPAVNQRNPGSAVPLKFSLEGDRGLDVLAEASPASRAIECETGEPLGGYEPSSPAGESGLHYDPVEDQYVYAWKTDVMWAGCRELLLTLADGSEHAALFRFG